MLGHRVAVSMVVVVVGSMLAVELAFELVVELGFQTESPE